MKRHIDSFYESNKRQKIFTNKRKGNFEEPSPKRHCESHPVTNLKRKCSAEPAVQKRLRTEEVGALHRMLTDAYARIEYLESELRDAKIRERYFTEKTNLPYNHNILCY